MAAGVLAQVDGGFVGPEVNWFALSPLLALAGGALLLMLLGALTPRWPRGLYAAFGATVAGTAGALAMVQWDDITDNGATITVTDSNTLATRRLISYLLRLARLTGTDYAPILTNTSHPSTRLARIPDLSGTAGCPA